MLLGSTLAHELFAALPAPRLGTTSAYDATVGLGNGCGTPDSPGHAQILWRATMAGVMRPYLNSLARPAYSLTAPRPRAFPLVSLTLYPPRL